MGAAEAGVYTQNKMTSDAGRSVCVSVCMWGLESCVCVWGGCYLVLPSLTPQVGIRCVFFFLTNFWGFSHVFAPLSVQVAERLKCHQVPEDVQ